MNPERILIAPKRLDSTRWRCRAPRTMPKSASCSTPIGKNQAVQHPLAKNWMRAGGSVADGAVGGLAYDQGAAMRPPCREISRG